MARVMTISSGFFDVLSSTVSPPPRGIRRRRRRGARFGLHGIEGTLAGCDVAEHRA
jgi:hypothetical protein